MTAYRWFAPRCCAGGRNESIIARLMKMLTRVGYLVEEQGMTYLADIGPDNPLKLLQAAACT